MRLVVREYLSMLRERDELDKLLPDLLLNMGVEPTSRAQVGVRQHGVDVAAVGPDPDDGGRRKLFLLTVKQGDIDRRSWNGTQQAVRQSLDEILDSYLNQRLAQEHEALPKKIVVCCNGYLKQAVAPDWEGYKNRNALPGVREYDFWGGDKLAVLIERHFLDEYLFPESAQKQMRKTIALADQNEDEPRHFYSMVHDTLFERDLPTEDTPSARRQRQRALRLLNLSLNIVYHWCREADNLRPALLCAERAVLLVWDWMRRGGLLSCETTRREFEGLFSTYVEVLYAYAKKLVPLCLVRDGLFGQGDDELEYPLRTFEVIGTFGVLCMTIKHLAGFAEDDAARQDLENRAREVAEVLANLIVKNAASATPLFDGHAVDVALGLLALTEAGLRSRAAAWLENLGVRVWLAYRMGRHFPIYTDRYDDLVAMRFGQALPKEDLMQISTLLPMLAHWHAVLNLPEPYETFWENVVDTFTSTTLQLWLPDRGTEDHLYRENAGFASGVVFAPIRLPSTLEELKAQIMRLHDTYPVPESLSCFSEGWSILGLVASRHYRTPVMPAYWRRQPEEPAREE